MLKGHGKERHGIGSEPCVISPGVLATQTFLTRQRARKPHTHKYQQEGAVHWQPAKMRKGKTACERCEFTLFSSNWREGVDPPNSDLRFRLRRAAADGARQIFCW